MMSHLVLSSQSMTQGLEDMERQRLSNEIFSGCLGNMCTVTTRKQSLTAPTKLACPLDLSTFMVKVQRGVGQICSEFTTSRSELAANSFCHTLFKCKTFFHSCRMGCFKTPLISSWDLKT